MSNEEVRKVMLQDIQLVQNLIERCLQLYMNKREIVSTLLHQAKIEPGFTELVWQKLEAENQEFFRAYHLRLMVKDQILQFNQLLERQVHLMRQMSLTTVASTPMSHGSQIHSMHNNLAYQSPQPSGPPIKPEDMQRAVCCMSDVYTYGESSQPSCMAANAGSIDFLAIDQSPNTRMMQRMNGGMVKSDDGYTCDFNFMFCVDNNPVELHDAIGEASVSPSKTDQSTSQGLNETALHTGTNSLGFLGQITRNLSLSDLTADFSNSNDILEKFSGSPFLGTDENILEPRIRVEQQGTESRRLDTILEGLIYEDFYSD